MDRYTMLTVRGAQDLSERVERTDITDPELPRREYVVLVTRLKDQMETLARNSRNLADRLEEVEKQRDEARAEVTRLQARAAELQDA